ncbi:hypothetical protein KQI52_11995 [bacterium]|nr:hypothetical protein [bacterium]
MKTIILFTTLLFLLAGTAAAQWDFVEEFADGMPAGWTGIAWSWIEDGPLYDSPYIHTLQTEDSDLYTTPVDVSGAEFLVIQFHYFVKGSDGSSCVSVAFDPNGPWDTIFSVDAPYGINRGVANETIPENLILGDQLFFKLNNVLSPDGGIDEFAINDLRVSQSFPGWVYIDSELTSDGVIFSTGGPITVDVTIANTTMNEFTNFRLWHYIQVPYYDSPAGLRLGPLQMMPVQVPANGSITISDLTVNIPSFAPVGTYTLYTYTGYPANPVYQVMDSVISYKIAFP